MSAGCFFWLQRLQPVFFVVAIASLVYEGWLVSRRPEKLRKWQNKMIVGVSLLLNLALIGGWTVISLRYR